MESIADEMPSWLEKRREEHAIDPGREIDEVLSRHMINIVGDAVPPFPDDEGREQEFLVCDYDTCHWTLCQECPSDRHECIYPARHPVHLRIRSGWRTYQKPVASGGTVLFYWYSTPCSCNPYQNKINAKLDGKRDSVSSDVI